MNCVIGILVTFALAEYFDHFNHIISIKVITESNVEISSSGSWQGEMSVRGEWPVLQEGTRFYCNLPATMTCTIYATPRPGIYCNLPQPDEVAIGYHLCYFYPINATSWTRGLETFSSNCKEGLFHSDV